ncbi:MAG: protein-tyrosine-phosphatase [Bacteroidetes bacterium]|nr:protein-tyrosine-phosphatase [Bacteroidota bacterium]
MMEAKVGFYPPLREYIEKLPTDEISFDRKNQLARIADYLKAKTALEQIPSLIFICTHNSRRSQLAQIWAQTAAWWNHLEANCYSGGTEVTAMHDHVASVIRKAGFKVCALGIDNPQYTVFPGSETNRISAHSKIYSAKANPQSGFAAIMTCSDADENCPFIPGAEVRISLPFEDPKTHDGQKDVLLHYEATSKIIASQMFYLFSLLNQSDVK